MRLLASLTATVLLAGCSAEKTLSVDDAWVRLAAVPGRPAAGYFMLHGGAADATLVSVSTDSALRTEMHNSRAIPGGGMTMDSIRDLRVPAGGAVSFAPAGRHVMMFDVDPGIKPGAGITLTLRFADGEARQVDARVIAAGDPAPTF